MPNQWWKVVLEGRDDLVKRLTSEDLITRYVKACGQAGNPADADVYTTNMSGEDTGRARTYFFEPAAANFAKGLLAEYSAKPCRMPDLNELRKL
jgi:hypothetical protein